MSGGARLEPPGSSQGSDLSRALTRSSGHSSPESLPWRLPRDRPDLLQPQGKGFPAELCPQTVTGRPGWPGASCACVDTWPSQLCPLFSPGQQLMPHGSGHRTASALDKQKPPPMQGPGQVRTGDSWSP